MAIFDKPFSFDSLVRDISSRYHLGPKGRSLVEEALDVIAEPPDGTGGFLDRFRAAGLGAEVTSWLAGGAAAPISGQQVEEALGAEAISEIADRAGITERFAKTVLGYAIPKIIGWLARSGLLDVAIATASSRADETPRDEEEQFPPGELEEVGAVPWYRKWFVTDARPTFSPVVIPIAYLLIGVGLTGYFASTGRAHHAATRSAPVMAKNAPNVIPPASSVPVHDAAIQSSSGTGKNAPVAVLHVASIPARLALSNKDGLIVYSGAVEDDATRTAITDSLKTVFGADKISGELAIDKHAGPAGWTPSLKTALGNFKTPGSRALFEGNDVSVGGTIPDAERDRIISSLISTLGPKFVFATIPGTGETRWLRLAIYAACRPSQAPPRRG